MAAGAATPPHRDDCDEVVLSLAGWGELRIDGQAQRFGAGSTLVLPGGREHQIFCIVPMAREIIGIFGATPVATYGPDGQALALPWRS
jgi:quercetin dioxygenase-like cupin family protein